MQPLLQSIIGKDPGEYNCALGRNEIKFIKLNAIPRMNYYQSLQAKELPEDGLALLAQYMNVAPHPCDPKSHIDGSWSLKQRS